MRGHGSRDSTAGAWPRCGKSPTAQPNSQAFGCNWQIAGWRESGALGDIQIVVDAVAGPRRGGFHGISGKVGVAGGCLHLGVTEQLADHREPLAECQRAGGKGVAKVMDADVVEFGTRPDAAPRVLKVGEVAAGLLAGDHPRIVLFAR